MPGRARGACGWARSDDGIYRKAITGLSDLTNVAESLKSSEGRFRVDEKIVPVPAPKGMLIYTRDGHMSVQLMYPDTAKAQSDEYVQNGYEASFGSYDVNEATHVTWEHY